MSFFQLASQRMSWLGARQAVISENIANADTPNYRAKEISGFDRMVQARTPTQGLAVTDAQHIRTTASTPDGVRVETDDAAWESALDGNNVVLEQQTIKSAEVAGNYRLAAELYRKGHDLLTVAVTGIR
ncbi:flagellar basal body rod protein FlgB [Marinovum sp.]|uniref:flagellar basal body rod protein FlgB n=1 Tax=Marinovum sp. TaxID=2024839 RepID=UPI002B2772EE|nr:flagellar basal body protein [Marinovum sp.]